MYRNKTIYSNKAEKYAKYRWDYAHEAIAILFTTANITPKSVVADIGAGTGILTKHFTGKVGQIFAIEPNHQMRAFCDRDLAGISGCTVLDANAEQTTLPDHSIDLITVGQAIHWFNPEPTRREFRRILMSTGWLALIRNQRKESPMDLAIEAISTPENGINFSLHETPSHKTPPEFYFGGKTVERQIFPFAYSQNFESFFGGMCSASYMPDEDHPQFAKLQREVREIFYSFHPDGWYELQGETELIIGQIC